MTSKQKRDGLPHVVVVVVDTVTVVVVFEVVVVAVTVRVTVSVVVVVEVVGYVWLAQTETEPSFTVLTSAMKKSPPKK